MKWDPSFCCVCPSILRFAAFEFLDLIPWIWDMPCRKSKTTLHAESWGSMQNCMSKYVQYGMEGAKYSWNRDNEIKPARVCKPIPWSFCPAIQASQARQMCLLHTIVWNVAGSKELIDNAQMLWRNLSSLQLPDQANALSSASTRRHPGPI